MNMVTPSRFSHHVSCEVLNLLILADKDLLELRNSKGKHAQFLCDVCNFYLDWHIKSYGAPGMLQQYIALRYIHMLPSSESGHFELIFLVGQ
jgi:hypothetical protein